MPPPISNFTKVRPVGAALIHEDRRTDMTKVTGAFRDFANAPKNATQLKCAQSVTRNTRPSLFPEHIFSHSSCIGKLRFPNCTKLSVS